MNKVSCFFQSNFRKMEEYMEQQNYNAPSIIRKIGKTTYIVRAYFNENAAESIDDKIKQMLHKEMEREVILEKK